MLFDIFNHVFSSWLWLTVPAFLSYWNKQNCEEIIWCFHSRDNKIEWLFFSPGIGSVTANTNTHTICYTGLPKVFAQHSKNGAFPLSRPVRCSALWYSLAHWTLICDLGSDRYPWSNSRRGTKKDSTDLSGWYHPSVFSVFWGNTIFMQETLLTDTICVMNITHSGEAAVGACVPDFFLTAAVTTTVEEFPIKLHLFMPLKLPGMHNIGHLLMSDMLIFPNLWSLIPKSVLIFSFFFYEHKASS